MILQTRDLVMIALGSEGEPARWFGPPLESGVHLRWAFRSQLGFPGNGFTLYRRTHAGGSLVTVPGRAVTTSVTTLPEVARQIVAEFSNPRWRRFFPPPSPLPSIVGYFEDVPVAEDSQPSIRLIQRRLVYSLESDAIDSVRSETPGRWQLQRLRYVPVSQDVDTGWEKLDSLCLALTDPNYSCHRGNPNPVADWQEAARRIPGGVVQAYLGTQQQPSKSWQQLHQAQQALFNPPIPSSLNIPPNVETNEPGLVGRPLDLMLLASIDPYVARILGLYLTDTTAQPGQAHDYKLEGQWIKNQLKFPEVNIDFEADRPGRRFPETFLRDHLIFRCLGRGRVVKMDNSPWNDTKQALDLPASASGALVRIGFDPPVTEVQLYIHVLSGDPTVKTSLANVNTTGWRSENGKLRMLSVAARNKNDRIELVSLEPKPNSPELKVALCKVGVLQTWSPPFDEQRAWITYNVTPAAPDAIASPTGPSAKPIKMPARELAEETVVTGPRTGLRWDLEVSNNALLPRHPVRYVVERQGLGSAAFPTDINPFRWQTVNDAPVTVTAAEGGPASLFIDDPAVDAAPNEADRFYAYRVAGIDLFGRLGSYSAAAKVDLRDTEPPPAPINVEAKYLDPADPNLSADEQQWVNETDPPRSGLKVQWEWPPSLRRQAPDAREFRLYVQPGRLNTLTGRVTEVTENADETYTVKTEQALPDNATDAFVREWFLSGGVYFTVIGNTASSNFEVRLRPPSAPPTARPVVGPFTLSIRPPRALEGSVTRAKSHLNGTVTLRTDQTAEISENSLTGKWLRQGGQDFRIISNETGVRFRLVVMGKGFPPKAPTIGGFLVMEADRTTAFLTDPGNPLYVDYRLAENWAQRLHVTPLTDAISYGVIIPFNELVASPSKPVAYAHVGVSTADDKDYVSDDPRWDGTPFGGRPGNEGMVSAPVLVHTVHRQAPDRPDPPDLGDGLATAADYHGRSFIAVSWDKLDSMRFEVYRAMDEAIFAADQKARPTRSTNRDDYPWFSDEDFEALVIQTPDYTNLSEELLQGLAGLPGTAAAFGLVTSEPLDPDESSYSDPDDPARIIYQATLDGKTINRHCFALKVVDPAGNRSELGWPSVPAHAPKVLPPRAPVITKVIGGDRQITLRWASNRESDLAEYRIYRTETQQNAHDPRLMTLVQSEPVPSGDPSARPAELAWVDTTLPTLVPVYYRIGAVDMTGNASAPSRIASVQAFDDRRPDPPIWQTATPGDDTVELSWNLADSTHRPLVQRRDPLVVPIQWENLSNWLTPGTAHMTDDKRGRGRIYVYRIRVLDDRGRTNREFNELQI